MSTAAALLKEPPVGDVFDRAAVKALFDLPRETLFARVDDLLDTVGIPKSLAEAGVTREEFDAALPDLARLAFTDASMRTNPRIPLLGELVELFQAGFEGRG